MGTKEFYEDMYKDGGNTRLPFLYRKLARFETTRYDMTCKLAPGGNRILDVGCGEGEILFILRDRYHEVCGVDISASRIERIKARLEAGSNISVSVQDANAALEFPDGSFDTVTAVAMLEHVFDPYSFVRECYRLLRPGGTLIIEVPNIAWLPRRIELLFGKFPSTSGELGWDGGHLHYFTRSSLKRLLTEEGFKVTRLTSGGIFAGPRRLWGSMLAADIVAVAVKPDPSLTKPAKRL